MRLRKCAFIFVAVLGGAALDARADEPSDRGAIKQQVRELFQKENYLALEKLGDQYRSGSERLSSGEWKLRFFYAPFSDGPANPNSEDWKVREQRTTSWLKRYPESPSAPIAAATVLHWHAWAFRNDGAFNAYAALVESARRMLDDHKEARTVDPQWYAARISLARSAGEDSSAILKLADEGLRLHPSYYPIHYAAVRALRPNGGGSYELLQQYVLMAYERTREKEGLQAYTRIYWDLANHESDVLNALNLGGAQWPLLKQGFDEINRAFPSSWNRDAERGFACFAAQKADYAALTPTLDLSSPAVGWWDTPEQRKACYDWAIKGKEQHTPWSQQIQHVLTFWRGYGSSFWRQIELEIAAFAALVACWLYVRRKRAPAATIQTIGSSATLDPNSAPAFDAANYPRDYFRKHPRLAAAIRTVALGLVSVFTLTRAPGLTRQVIEIAVAYFAWVSFEGYRLWRRAAYRLTLSAEAMDIKTGFRQTRFARSALSGYTKVRSLSGETNVALLASPSGPVEMELPADLAVDPAFWAWLATIPEAPAVGERLSRFRSRAWAAIWIALVVGAGALTVFWMDFAEKLDRTSREFADESIQAISAHWSADELLRRGSPELVEIVGLQGEKIPKLYAELAKLGTMKSYAGAKGRASFEYDPAFGRTVTAWYTAQAQFENGPADFGVRLVQNSDGWQIGYFHIDSPVLKQDQ